MKKIIALGSVVAVVLAGCNLLPGNDGKTNSLDYKIDRSGNGSQQDPVMINNNLPVKKLVITSGQNRRELEVEIASTDAQRKVGLMNRTSLDENKGMLFAFDRQGYLYFWMKNTLIPLDMVFIGEDGYVRHIAKNSQPCTGKTDAACPKISSEQPAKFVLEVNAGMADKWGLSNGDKVTWL
jgi:uncharacterized membrane protein (UPF0127 family)